MHRQGAEALSDYEARELVNWFTQRMSMAERHALMTERPMAYAKMYPSVRGETLAEKITSEVAAMRVDDALSAMHADMTDSEAEAAWYANEPWS